MNNNLGHYFNESVVREENVTMFSNCDDIHLFLFMCPKPSEGWGTFSRGKLVATQCG